MNKITASNISMLILMTSLLVVKITASALCPDTWTVFSDSCYKFVNKQTTWFDAQVICKTANSHVVRIESSEEDNFVQTMARLHGAKVWIGLSDLLQEGRFVWDETQREPAYTNWLPGSPNGGGDDCASIWLEQGRSQWADSPCEFLLSTICEKKRI